MLIDENENQPESDDRAIQVTNCTIYVGRVRIVVDPRLNSDCTSIVETRATEDHNGSSVNTPPKQDLVGIRKTSTYFIILSVILPYSLIFSIFRASKPLSTYQHVVRGPAQDNRGRTDKLAEVSVSAAS